VRWDRLLPLRERGIGIRMNRPVGSDKLDTFCYPMVGSTECQFILALPYSNNWTARSSACFRTSRRNMSRYTGCSRYRNYLCLCNLGPSRIARHMFVVSALLNSYKQSFPMGQHSHRREMRYLRERRRSWLRRGQAE
jgi:hypothetical protein